MTAPSIREALKPCPFCGSDRVSSAHQRDGRVIGCAGCGARVGAFQPGAEEKATEKWNTRTTPAPPQDAVERIARIIKKVAFGGIPTDEPTPICYMTAKIILASGLVTASRPSRKITMSDVRLIAGEGKLSAHDVLAAVTRADWIICTDGKARPIEPGTQPLAHGQSNRVGRLRAYGNAMHRAKITQFILAADEAIGATS